MKFLLSSLLLLMLAHPVQEDQNKYLLIFTALVPPSNGSVVLTGTSNFANIPNSTSQFTYYQSHYEDKNQVFSSFEDAQNFVHSHTVHYLDNGSYTQPWDFTITDITGFYKLRRLESHKIESGKHIEYITSTQEVEKPSYEMEHK